MVYRYYPYARAVFSKDAEIYYVLPGRLGKGVQGLTLVVYN